jgi:hypothetical protein
MVTRFPLNFERRTSIVKKRSSQFYVRATRVDLLLFIPVCVALNTTLGRSSRKIFYSGMAKKFRSRNDYTPISGKR